MRKFLPLLEEIRARLERGPGQAFMDLPFELRVTEGGAGGLAALGWKPTQPKPPHWTVTYVKGDKKLFKKKGSWYIDDQKLGRLSDKRLIAKLRALG